MPPTDAERAGPADGPLGGDEPAGPRAALGVLFVHGIGSQTRGETLTECASAVVDWWRAWVPQTTGEVTVEQTVLALEPARYEPAHARVRVTPAIGEASRRVLLAESWWAADVNPPRFRELAGWMLTFGSWIVITHVLGYVRARTPTAGLQRLPDWLARGIFAGLVWIGGAIALFGTAMGLFVVQLLLVLLGVLNLIPVPTIRRWVAGLVLALEGVIGDSYAFSGNVIGGSAVASRVRRDLEWIVARSDAVVVVAHSQGAAVAVRALEQFVATAAEAPRKRVRKLITYGSGLVKLSQLEEMTRPPQGHPGVIQYLWLIITSIGLAVPYVAKTLGTAVTVPIGQLREVATLDALWDGRLYAFLAGGPVRPLAEVVALLWTMLGIVLLLAFAAAGAAAYRRAEAIVGGTVRKLCAHVAWVDLYATKDPVPNGALPVEPRPAELVSGAVVNMLSFFRDHVTYWRNIDEFVTRVVRELNGVTAIVHLRGDDWHAAAAARRARRQQALAGLRWLTLLAAAGAILGQAGWVIALGRTRVAPLVGAVLPESVGQVVRNVAASPAGFHQALTTTGGFALGAIALGLVAWVCYRVPREIWDWWDRTEVRILLRGDPPNPYVRRLAVLLLVPLAAIGLWTAASVALWGVPRVAGNLVGAWDWAQATWLVWNQGGPPGGWRLLGYRMALIAMAGWLLVWGLAFALHLMRALARRLRR